MTSVNHRLVVVKRHEARIYTNDHDSTGASVGHLECPQCGGGVSIAIPIYLARPTRNGFAKIKQLPHTDHLDREHDEDCHQLVCVECRGWMDTPLGLEIDF